MFCTSLPGRFKVFSQLKRHFVWMNQRARPNAKTDIEKDFYKLMNNTNFGEPIIDEVSKSSCMRRYHTFFDSKVSNFVNNDLLDKETKQNFQLKMANIKNDDPLKMQK